MSQRDPEDLEPEAGPLDEHRDAPEADYLDQHDELLPEYRRGPSLGVEVPEADALDQAIDADYDDDGFTGDGIDGDGFDDVDDV